MALRGIKVLEFAGLAPAPFCGMILSDFGANVINISKVGPKFDADRLTRGKKSICVNLKSKAGLEIVQNLAKKTDVVIDPFRAGVLEKLGLGPSILLQTNPKLIFARLTGYGQTGPYADKAGHDINYLATAGVLSMLGRKNENPLGPINLLADFAGGGLMCAFGICLALLQRTKTGKGQVIDANMVENSAYVSSFLWLTQEISTLWGSPRGENVLDGGAHFYDTYKTKDSKYMAVGAIEPQFYENLLKGLGVNPEEVSQFDFELGKQKFAEIFATKTREEWTKIFDKLDACVTPVMELTEAHKHPHNLERESFVANSKDTFAPLPAPTIGSSRNKISLTLPKSGQHTAQILLEAGYTEQDLTKFTQDGVIECNAASKL